jgi:2-polyprenyl-6-methoxyphenol hydroxylase-like FAD-dependent oxidoreductase
MTKIIGRHAVVVGAGMGGLAAARALSAWFERVTLLDRDTFPAAASQRSGVPQGRQLHALLAGGQHALEALASGFTARLTERGAQTLTVGLDVRDELPPFDPFPQRDLGIVTYSATRPVIEAALRELCLATPNVHLESGVTAHAIACDEGRVTGVHCRRAEGDHGPQLIAAELVVDASGAGELTLACLKTQDLPLPPTTRIGIDVGYASALFELPAALGAWKGVRTLPSVNQSTRGAMLLPVEDNRWLVALGGRANDYPPGDPAGFMAALKSLRTSTIADAVAQVSPPTSVARFGFNESLRRHFESLEPEHFPLGLLPLGDAICRFNPIYGQGMSVAAQQALALHELLALRSQSEAEPLRGLSAAYFARCAELIDAPWQLAAIPDLAFSETRGDRPADLDQQLKRGRALLALAAEDPEVHKLQMEVFHLLKPRSAFVTSPLAPRIQAYMARAGSLH